MKRSRDDVYFNPQFKRPVIPSRAEPLGQAQMSTASSAQKLTTSDALTYLKAVKEMFQDKKDKYEEFLDVMKEFKAQRIDTNGVTARVKELFKGHRDLILGFNTFLPKGYEITLPPEDEPYLKKKPVQFDEAINFVNKIKTRFDGDDHVYKDFLAILNMYKKDNKSIQEVYHEVSGLFKDHADLLVEFTHFLPDASGAASINYAQSGRNHITLGDDRGFPINMHANHPDSEHWNSFGRKGKIEDTDNNEWENDNLDHKRKSARRDDSVIDKFHQGMQDPTSAICEKAQEIIHDPENYKKFLDCIRSYKRKFVTTPQFRMLVATLLGTHPDLMEECEDLIIYVEKTGLRNSKQVSRALKVEDRDGDDLNREEGIKSKEMDGYDRGLTINTKDVQGQKTASYAIKEKFMAKPIQDLDLSNCKSCTPSYRLLPENVSILVKQYPISSASWRTEIGKKVLNDHWVSVTSGSEDYSFKHMRKNQYEESLFRCEDDRFELDMLFESVTATAKRVEELLDSMNAHTHKIDSPFRVEDHLTALNLRCIERLYGDHGLDVMDVLRKNAPLALPVILTRLKQKQEEWAKCRADFNKVWAEIYAKNYHKSLDHRSFYFKQQDTKNLSAKAMLAEIKEISEKSHNEDELALSIGAGYRQPIRPDIEYEYPDLDIQEDLYQLMQFSCGEVCTPEQRDKVMKIWTTFIESVFNVPSRPTSAGDSEDIKADNQIMETIANIGEEKRSPAKDVASDNGVNIDGSLETENVAHKGERLCNVPENGVIHTDSVMMPAIPVASKQAGSFEQGTGGATGEMIIDKDKKNGPEGATTDCRIELMPNKESQMVPEDVKAQECDGETEVCPKNEGEDGKLSPKINIGEEMCINEVEGETDANNDDEIEESAHGSSDSENCSENVDVSASESADDMADEDVDRDENNNKAESEGEADDVADDHDNGVAPTSDPSLEEMKPLNMRVPMVLIGENKKSQIFYGNDSFYLLFRLHKMLYERMQSAKLHSACPENGWRTLNDINPTDSYARFKDALRNLLNGSSDNAKFEDDCRAIIGAQSYILFTLDKLIHKLVKQLQIIATEEVDNRLFQLYAYERSRTSEYFTDAVYHENARFILPEDNLYRIECFPSPTRLTIQLMTIDHNKPEATPVSIDPNFTAYLNEELLSVVPWRKEHAGVFLMRNKRNSLTGDEVSDFCNAMEGVINYNGLEIKLSCSTLKASYVLGTEDFFFRTKRRRKELYGSGSSHGDSNGASNGTSNGCSRRMKSRILMFS